MALILYVLAPYSELQAFIPFESWNSININMVGLGAGVGGVVYFDE